jgi:hypothetical protein
MQYQYPGASGQVRLESAITSLRNSMQRVCDLVNTVNAQLPAATTTYKAKLPAAHLSPRCLTQAECNLILAEAQGLALLDGDDFSVSCAGTSSSGHHYPQPPPGHTAVPSTTLHHNVS